MIFSTILSWVTDALGLLIGLLPDVDVDIVTEIISYNTQFREMLTAINWFFPVNIALAFLGIIFIIQLSLFLFKLVKYIAGVLTVGILK